MARLDRRSSSGTAQQWYRRAFAALSRTARVVRFVAGAPDYERYVAHVRTHHPSVTPLSRDEFERQRLADRYDRPGARCC